MDNFFQNRRERLFMLKAKREQVAGVAESKPQTTCTGCGESLPQKEFVKNMMVCPKCGYHMPIGAYYRMSLLLDSNSFKELDSGLMGGDPLRFPGYMSKLAGFRQRTGLREAVVTARGKIGGHSVIIAVLDSRFLMGSMGFAVGEKVTRAILAAQKAKLPLVIFSASGGARMQEGIISLMQMAKTSAAVERFSAAGGLYVVCMTHPTTGGVTASFASLADITLAEPGALIGFAGPRVIEQTIGQTLPEGFQRAEFLQDHGFVDEIVPRQNLKDTLTKILGLHTAKRRKP